MQQILSNLVDLHTREIYSAQITIEGGVIASIERLSDGVDQTKPYAMPGFVDAHLHIESSMLTPRNFSRMVVPCGTVAVVTDPHEIANVMGCEGIDYMLRDAKHASLKCYFTIPSCVPATPFDRAGGVVTAKDVERMVESGEFVALSEMMNVPGVLSGDEEVMQKLDSARRRRMPIDGHAPSLRGEDLAEYVANSIGTDHEVTTIEEGREKIHCGMKILIREGSAARNYESLAPLIAYRADMVMFCTDDSHPDDILRLGHIDKLVRRAVADGYDLFDVLRIASINAIHHYSLGVGELRVGDSADFIVVVDLVDFRVVESYIDGARVVEQAASEALELINRFHHDPITVEDIRLPISSSQAVIGVIDGELYTTEQSYTPMSPCENFEGDISEDLAKIVYVNRYTNGEPQVALVRGLSLQRGAFASSVAHDSHNIIAVGVSDEDLVGAINSLIESRGGLFVYCGGEVDSLPLPIAGIMSDRSGDSVAADYERLASRVHELGCCLRAPFMTLSFLSLVVIPELKISEQGLFRYSDL